MGGFVAGRESSNEEEQIGGKAMRDGKQKKRYRVRRREFGSSEDGGMDGGELAGYLKRFTSKDETAGDGRRGTNSGGQLAAGSWQLAGRSGTSKDW